MIETVGTGDFEAANDALEERGATDGLPVIPPTEDRVEALIVGTGLDADFEVGAPGPGAEPVTVRDLAVTGVMAGCTPIHLPVIVAGVRALDAADLPDDASGSWAYQWIVNGPIRHDIDVRSDTGAFGPGFMSNRTVGRALGLARQNACGEVADEGALGNPFKYSLVAAENEDRSPWDPFHVESGFDPEESTITFSLRRSFIQFTPYDMNPRGALQGMRYNTIPEIAGSDRGAYRQGVTYTISPYIAEEFANEGWEKREVEAYLAANTYVDVEKLGRDPEDADGPRAVRGTAPLQEPQIESPETVDLFVVGGSGVFISVGGTLGDTVTVPIETPDDWDALVEEHLVEREWGKIDEYYG